ncbi:ankyrin repeat domain-containing protein [Treponema sp.]|uniref:ankyrin repeat domain-containing protein n=1 Tax=Treponema sp. TaxID=166 RepID=UPI00298D7BF0|nr:ankyrin repeat domain-containing protein [Treponema sp.]
MKEELINAVLKNDIEEISRILAKQNKEEINFQDKNGFTALHYAIQDNKYEIAIKLLDSGADFEIPDKYGNTAIIRAVASFRGDGRIIELLLSKGADFNKKNNYGISAIEHARNVANYNITQFFY